MVRVFLFFLIVIALAFAEAWLVEQPGGIVLTWREYRLETSILVGVGVVVAAAAALLLLWGFLRFTFRIPSVMAMSSRSRRRDRGYAAISRGMLAVGAGDADTAHKSAAEAEKYLRDEPLTLLLKAQVAQLSELGDETETAFREMTYRSETRLVGLRGLHAEAHRRGEMEKAHYFASAAHEIAPLPWTARAGVEHRAATGDWRSALATLESDSSAKLLDKKTRERHRAVLETALALEKAEKEPDEALRLALAATKREPHLVPAVGVLATLWGRNGDIRKATKLIEREWRLAPHPDYAKVYLNLHDDDTSADRLARARTLARLAPDDVESKIIVARAAIAAGDFRTARESMLPLIEAEERPTTRMCLLMADLEEAEHGSEGFVREWLARASRAARDSAWTADGVVSDQWLPASPVTGKLDAFVWRKPPESLGKSADMDDAIFTSISASPPPVEIEVAPRKALAPPKPEPAIESPRAIEAVAPPAAARANGSAVRDKSVAETVIFPLPTAPDDPGQDEKPKRRRFGRFF